MAVAQGVDALAFKPTLSGPEEERLAASRLRERVQSAVEAPFTLRSERPSNLSVSDELRQAKNQAALQNSRPLEMKNTLTKEKFGTSLKGLKNIMSGLRDQAKEAKEKASITNTVKKAVEGAVATPVSMATSEALKQAWLNLIDSFGLTLIYINFHIFCRFVFGEKLFCKLGHEWIGGKTGSKGGNKGMSGILGLPLDAMGIVEAMAVGILDTIIILLLFITIIPYIVAVQLLLDPIGAVKSIL